MKTNFTTTLKKILFKYSYQIIWDLSIKILCKVYIKSIPFYFFDLIIRKFIIDRGLYSSLDNVLDFKASNINKSNLKLTFWNEKLGSKLKGKAAYIYLYYSLLTCDIFLNYSKSKFVVIKSDAFTSVPYCMSREIQLHNDYYFDKTSTLETFISYTHNQRQQFLKHLWLSTDSNYYLNYIEVTVSEVNENDTFWKYLTRPLKKEINWSGMPDFYPFKTVLQGGLGFSFQNNQSYLKVNAEQPSQVF